MEAERNGLVLESAASQDALRATLIAARRSFRVLFTGPSGSGKSAFAERYHRYWNKSERMVTVNCSQFGVDENLNHALLFGCAPGAVSNAMRRGSPGYVGEADGSTLFLDEVALLPPAVQANLLLFLDGTGSYRPLGGAPKNAAVRVVCATNADLRSLVREGKFREDLWHRLRGVEVALPSLRERPEDLSAWLRQRDGAEREVIAAMTPEAHDALFEHTWTGGFRELGNVLNELSLQKELRRLERIDHDTVRAAIVAASPAVVGAIGATATASRPQPLALQPAGESAVDPRWAAVVSEALQWFFREPPRALRYPQLEDFVKQYLRPTFVAHGCQLAGQRERPPRQSPESLGRMIDLGRDMVSAHLERYFTRP